MRKQFIIGESNSSLRVEFYNYIHENYDLEEHFLTSGEIENSKFPFVVDFSINSFWICNSITCCACAAQKNLIMTISEFKNMKHVKKRVI